MHTTERGFGVAGPGAHQPTPRRGPYTGSIGAPEDPADRPSQLLRYQALGGVGALILGAVATVAGVRPVTGASWLGWTIDRGQPAPTIAVAGAYFGLTLLVGAWLAVGRLVREHSVTPAALVRTLILWSIPLAVAPPLYSRDVYSYVVQGAMFRDGIDPYRYGPASYANDLAPNVAEFWQNSTAPYGPVFLALAAAVMKVAGSDVILGVLGMRLVMIVALAGTAVLLTKLARRYRIDESSALWLGVLNPLVLFHVVSGAHNDILLVVVLLAGMLLASRGRPLYAATLVGAAVLIKASAVVALPFLVPAVARRIGSGRWSFVAAAMAVGAAAGAATALITAATGGWYGWAKALVDTTRVHNGLSMSTNLGDLLAWLGATGTPFSVLARIDTTTVTRGLALVLAGVLLLLILRRTRGRPLLGLGLALVMVVALGPVVHPWYLLWGFVPLAAATTHPQLLRVVAVVSVALAYYPMPSGGGPTPALLFGAVGTALGAVAGWALTTDRTIPARAHSALRLLKPRTAGDQPPTTPSSAASRIAGTAEPGA